MLLSYVFFLGLIYLSGACSTIGVGRLATTDGSTFTTHSDDGGPDPRLIFVPGAVHKEGEFRNIFPSLDTFPRYCGSDRGPSYMPSKENPCTPTKPLGQIPQIVGRTYAYTDAGYAVMNEVGLGTGESTCSSVFGASPIGKHGGKALLCIDELSRIALERCNSSRCAVQTMGDLAVQYGFYGESSGIEVGAESLFLNDAKEVWLFHVLPDDTGASAIWVAQRIPDDHIAVVANMFTIRDVNLTDTANFLGSQNMYTIAEKHGWWNPSGNKPLDFTAVFSDGEYAHRYYSGRRMWGIFGYLTPGYPLPANYTDLRTERVYPTTLPASRKINVTDLAMAHRSYYEGTPYDQSVGMAAGPWGLPERFPTWTALPGNWERTVSIYRTTYSHIAQANTEFPLTQPGVVYFGPHVAYTTVYLPYSSTVSELLPALSIGNPSKLSRKSAYWACKYIYNLQRIKSGPMMALIRPLQRTLEKNGSALVTQLMTSRPPIANVTQAYLQFHEEVVAAWWAFADTLMEIFADGEDGVSYPDWWLKAVGYENGPPPV